MYSISLWGDIRVWYNLMMILLLLSSGGNGTIITLLFNLSLSRCCCGFIHSCGLVCFNCFLLLPESIHIVTVNKHEFPAYVINTAERRKTSFHKWQKKSSSLERSRRSCTQSSQNPFKRNHNQNLCVIVKKGHVVKKKSRSHRHFINEFLKTS